MLLEQNYDELSRFYDKKYETGYMGHDRYGYWSHSGAQLRRILATIQSVPATAKSVLDYGCGQGAWMKELSGWFRQASLYGIDISDVAIRKAQDAFKNYTFSTFDGSRAPFSDESFDVVFSYHVLEHVVSVNDTIQDVARLVRKGGYACIVFPCGNGRSLEERVMRLMEGGVVSTPEGRPLHFYEPAIGHLRRMSTDETVKLFEEHGFSLLWAAYSNHYVGWIEWLVRGHDSNTIRTMVNESRAVSRTARFELAVLKRVLLSLNWITSKKYISLSRRRSAPKAIAARLAKATGAAADKLLAYCAVLEWRVLGSRRGGAAHFLVFQKV